MSFRFAIRRGVSNLDAKKDWVWGGKQTRIASGPRTSGRPPPHQYLGCRPSRDTTAYNVNPSRTAACESLRKTDHCVWLKPRSLPIIFQAGVPATVARNRAGRAHA